MSAEPSITQLLNRYSSGDRGAFEELAKVVYAQLRVIAKRHLGGRRMGQTLVPTMLVNEAFMRLMKNDELALRDRVHFFAVASRCMRWILTDHVRAKVAEKRGGHQIHVTLNDSLEPANTGDQIDLYALESALQKLGALDPKLAEVVELRFLAGLSIPEAAQALQTTEGTVKHRWNLARAWLIRELKSETDGESDTERKAKAG